MDSSEESKPEFEEMDDESAPEPNGDLGSWLYVIFGIPCMALFFVLYFGLVGSCDASNIMIHG